jgi:hypothetical protein
MVREFGNLSGWRSTLWTCGDTNRLVGDWKSKAAMFAAALTNEIVLISHTTVAILPDSIASIGLMLDPARL